MATAGWRRCCFPICVGDNEPYAVSDATDYTIPVHGEACGIPHVEIEIRQDLVDDETGQAAWADRLADCLLRGLAGFDTTDIA